VKRKPRRVVLGEGYPWFTFGNGNTPTSVALTMSAVHSSILLRKFDWVESLNLDDLGNWNRVRLVIEVLD
jgi:hypothetical protein